MLLSRNEAGCMNHFHVFRYLMDGNPARKSFDGIALRQVLRMRKRHEWHLMSRHVHMRCCCQRARPDWSHCTSSSWRSCLRYGHRDGLSSSRSRVSGCSIELRRRAHHFNLRRALAIECGAVEFLIVASQDSTKTFHSPDGGGSGW
jgi:hypothetical protein